MKVHILVTGWDKERAIWGCTRLGADKVYLIVPEFTKKKIESWVNEKTNKIAKSIKKGFSKYFPIEFVPVIYDDYLDCFKKVIKIIRKEKGNEILINIASGSHIATSAAIFAASITKCKAYYVQPEKYDEMFKQEKFISYGGRNIVDIPLLPIAAISEVEIEILRFIDKKGATSVTELAKEAQGIFDVPTRSKFNYYVDKLGDAGFLDNELVGGKLYTKINDTGRLVLEAFC
ncbi:MAG: hypothetical protein HY051_05060 [Candidatus Aenigmarchaeota archaeon]|nr:hypothetical protein [Candidatus Aenigmarchaeota archaeon]